MENEIKIDALKLIAESYGFELVEKKREIKVGDFGMFWDDKIDGFVYGFLIEIRNNYFKDSNYVNRLNFAYLTDEEKKAITENW